MPLINTSVPNLIQGVSQQPDASRFAGQCEEQENALSSVAEGLKKRPNTRHVARVIENASASNSLVHFVDRSETERYVIIHTGTHMYAYNLVSGLSASIWYNSVEYTNGWAIPSSHYLYNASNVDDNFSSLTIGDSTFFTNKTVTVDKTSDNTPERDEEAIVTVIQGDYQKRYQVNFGEGGDQGAIFTLTAQGFSYQYGPIGSPFTFKTGETFTSPGNSQLVYITGISIFNAGNGYPPNLSNNTTTIQLYNVQNSSDPKYYISISTNSSGQITSASLINTPQFNPNAVVGLLGGLASNSLNGILLTTGSASGSAGGQNASTERIAQGLAGDGTAGTNNSVSGSIPSDFNAERNGGVIKYKRNDGQNFSISTFDGLGDEGLSLAYAEVTSINDLPLRNFNGFQVKVIGDTELDQDDYYVTFKTADNSTFGVGSYNESAGFNVTLGIDSSTFPHRLVNDSLNSFFVQETPLVNRSAGDDVSNPFPSFVGKKINRLFVFRNRLGVLSEDNVVFSESDNLFNFFRTTVTTLLDSAPIDVTASSKNVVNIQSAVGFQENLILFSDGGSQFVLSSGDLLTSKTVSIKPITNFDSVNKIEPISLGSYLYFPFTKGEFSGVREFTVTSTTDNFDSSEITAHVPSYIPSNIKTVVGTTSENLIAVLSKDEANAIYLYSYFWSNNQKVLSSWSKFTFDGTIRGIEFIESSLYIVMAKENETRLLELPLESGLKDVDHNGSVSPFLTLLDNRVRAKITSGSSVVEFEQSDSSYSGANADHPYTFFNGTIPSGGQALSEVFVDSNGVTHSLKYQNVGAGGQVLLTDGNASATLYGYVGVPYTMKYKFSTQVFKAQTQKGTSPTASSSMQVRNGSLFFDDTHTFDIKVTPENRPTATTTFSADDVPEAEQLGAIKFAEGNFRFPVYSKAKHADIVIENDSPFDSKFSSAEFESFVHPRSSRYG